MVRIQPRNMFVAGLMLVGALLAASPWLLGFGGHSGAVASASIIAALLMLLGLASSREVRDWSISGALTLGAWSMIAPLLLGFGRVDSAFSAHLIAGFAAMALAVWTVDWRTQGPPVSHG